MEKKVYSTFNVYPDDHSLYNIKIINFQNR